MPTEDKQNPDVRELLDDIQFVNRSAEAEISRVSNQVRRHLNKLNLPQDVANSLIGEVSSQLGQLTAKVKITEQALHNLQSELKKPLAGKNIIASTQATKGDICYPARKLAGTTNLLPIEISPNGISYCWSGANPEIKFDFVLDRKKKIGIQIKLFALIKPEYFRQLKVIVDGEHIKHRCTLDDGLFVASCKLPQSNKTSQTEVKIMLPDTHRPSDLGVAQDNRKLGVAISEIRLGKPMSELTYLLKRLRLKK
jgi:hypothetical protein